MIFIGANPICPFKIITSILLWFLNDKLRLLQKYFLFREVFMKTYKNCNWG
nr:MAG TPA: hypothetical protein [Caudoviricetes sp.]